MFNVTFASFGEHIASSRLRASIPQQELGKLGIRQGRDVLVYGKHIVEMRQTRDFILRVYDVCDDHYSDYHANYYLEHTEKANLVTCNSERMKEIIREHTGRIAKVIPDPYESEESPAGFGSELFWFGHESNLKQISPYMDLKPEILTGSDWSRERQLEMLDRCGVVLIPTDERTGKSANRLIEAVRNGRFVVCGPLPAHEEFKPFMWVGDIREGVEWSMSHKDECIERVRACQDYIRDKYSPASIGLQWKQALDELWRSRPLQS